MTGSSPSVTFFISLLYIMYTCIVPNVYHCEWVTILVFFFNKFWDMIYKWKEQPIYRKKKREASHTGEMSHWAQQIVRQLSVLVSVTCCWDLILCSSQFSSRSDSSCYHFFFISWKISFCDKKLLPTTQLLQTTLRWSHRIAIVLTGSQGRC